MVERKGSPFTALCFEGTARGMGRSHYDFLLEGSGFLGTFLRFLFWA